MQMVRESDRAWHAGKSSWRGRDRHQFPFGRHRDRQSGPCARLPEFPHGPDRRGHQPLPRHRHAPRASCRERVLAHSDVAPGRKIDPGEKFPVAAAGAKPASVILSRRPVAGGALSSCPATAAARSRSCSRCWRSTAMASRSPASSTREPGAWCRGFPAAFPAAAGRRSGRPLDDRDAAPAACSAAASWLTAV